MNIKAESDMNAKWEIVKKIKSITGKEKFGKALSIDGNYAIVGSPTETVEGKGRAGAVYIFHKTDINGWDNGTKIVSPNVCGNSSFGYSVSINGNDAIVTAPRQTVNGLKYAGAAYVFHRTGEQWDSGTEIPNPTPEELQSFGNPSASRSGDYAIVGSRGRTIDGVEKAGSVYIFPLYTTFF